MPRWPYDPKRIRTTTIEGVGNGDLLVDLLHGRVAEVHVGGTGEAGVVSKRGRGGVGARIVVRQTGAVGAIQALPGLQRVREGHAAVDRRTRVDTLYLIRDALEACIYRGCVVDGVFSGASLSYALAGVLGGALAPYIAARLLNATGASWSVSAYLLAMALISFVSVLLLSETYQTDLSEMRTEERQLITEGE